MQLIFPYSFTTPISYSFPLITPIQLFCCFSNMAHVFLSQPNCASLLLCLDHSSLATHLVYPLRPFKSLLKCCLLKESYSDHLLKTSTHPIPSAFPTPYPPLLFLLIFSQTFKYTYFYAYFLSSPLGYKTHEDRNFCFVH